MSMCLCVYACVCAYVNVFVCVHVCVCVPSWQLLLSRPCRTGGGVGGVRKKGSRGNGDLRSEKNAIVRAAGREE